MRRWFLMVIFTTGCSSSPSAVFDVTELQALQQDLDDCHEAIQSEGMAVAKMHCSTAVTRFQEGVVVEIRPYLGVRRTTSLELQFGQLYSTLPTPTIESVEVLQTTIGKAIAEVTQPAAPSN